MVRSANRRWYAAPGPLCIANLIVFATRDGAEGPPCRGGEGDGGCEPSRHIRSARPRPGSLPAGPVHITRLRRLNDRHWPAVFIHGGAGTATTAAMFLFGPFSETAVRGSRIESDGPSSWRRSTCGWSRRPQYRRDRREGIGQCLRLLMFTPLQPGVNVRR